MSAAEQGAEHSTGRWLTVVRTLCFIVNEGAVLLMKRSAHKRIFPNRCNGVGGHVERDEDILTSVQREVLEETGLHVPNLRLVAVYNIDAGADTGITLFVFLGESAARTVIDSEEGTLEWVEIDQIGQHDLVEDIDIILPKILALPPGAPPLFVHVSYDAADHMRLRIHGS